MHVANNYDAEKALDVFNAVKGLGLVLTSDP
jgi:hypothetical protein